MSKILAIETSCDETAVTILEGAGTIENASFKILGDALLSQAPLHSPYGGVYPNLAKREHQNNLVPLAAEALAQAGMLTKEAGIAKIPDDAFEGVRDAAFKESMLKFLSEYEKPYIDLIAVTHGPGLEPALWTGINFATVLGKAWDIPVMGIDHMEGHILSALLETGKDSTYTLRKVKTPLLSLLISGGHTEFQMMKEWFTYERLGETKDDAVGEAFDKVARLLDLAYPGGPKIAEFAERSRVRGENDITFPKPLINEATCDFSFSGLKTAVLYKLQKMDKISEADKEHVAEAFENAARDVIVSKTRRALSQGAATFAVAGGVSANDEIRRALAELIQTEFPNVELYFPDKTLTGDNAIMIAAAAYLRLAKGMKPEGALAATGNLRL